ncbi:MAG: 16S rRNA methyltransferase [Neisseriaceae bacterium]|nr:MAG: 16S rRNA methyltransferase [Neisseriaceae bacterium]
MGSFFLDYNMLYICKRNLSLTELHYIEYISNTFGLSVCYQSPDKSYFLIWDGQMIGLKSSQYKKMLVVDFSSNRLLHRIGRNQGELILKAVNLKKHNQIWDATAGLGRDAFVLASFGGEVTMFERNPMIAAMLWDGIRRAKNIKLLVDIVQRMHLIYGSILDDHLVLPKLPEIIYLDPMFPERKKSACVKKEMIFLQKVVGEDSDCVQLFLRAKELGIPKIVVKRSKLAPDIEEGLINFSIKGQSTRFDIYLN